MKHTWLLLVVVGLLALGAGYLVPRQAEAPGSPRSAGYSYASPQIRSAQFHKRGRCVHARVFLGTSPGAIDFVVRCIGRPPGNEVGFVVTRDILPYPGVHTGIISFRHKLPLGRAGRHQLFGNCQRLRGQIACGARVPKKVRFVGRIFVNPKRRCEWGFGITTRPPRPHEGEGWSGPDIIRVLSRGRPQGC